MVKGYLESESAGRGHEAEEHHVVPLSIYFTVFGILIVGTILTVMVSLFDLDEYLFAGANTLLALFIALIKTSFVVLFFMHVRYSGKLIWLCVVGGIFWLGLMFLFTMSDYLTRGNGTFR